MGANSVSLSLEYVHECLSLSRFRMKIARYETFHAISLSTDQNADNNQ
jgi:hypothetical protein